VREPFTKTARLLFCACAILAGCLGASGTEKDARDAANRFYDVYLKVRPSGVPDLKQQEQFRPILSPALADLLSGAASAEASYAKATKGESPPLVEGDLFTSLFEGAESYKVGACKIEKESAVCAVDLDYTDPRDKSKVVWQDRVYLVREDDKWLVDDLEFLGTWEFMHKGRLKDLLTQVIDEAKDVRAD
jgi:Protein of unknown function (DUF3828)